MGSEADDVAFTHALQAVFAEVRASHPAAENQAEELLVEGFKAYGLTLTTEVVGALAFAVVHGS